MYKNIDAKLEFYMQDHDIFYYIIILSFLEEFFSGLNWRTFKNLLFESRVRFEVGSYKKRSSYP